MAKSGAHTRAKDLRPRGSILSSWYETHRSTTMMMMMRMRMMRMIMGIRIRRSKP
jgi:hypothetical protein